MEIDIILRIGFTSLLLCGLAIYTIQVLPSSNKLIGLLAFLILLASGTTLISSVIAFIWTIGT